MTNSHTRHSAIASLGALSFTAAALASRGTARAAERIRLGLLNSDAATPACYAQTVGSFADAGLDATLQVIASGAAVAAAVIGGSIDIGLSSLFALLSAHAHGVPLKMVAGAADFDKSFKAVTGLLVKANAPYQSHIDLDGKVVSVAALQGEMYVNIRSLIDRSGGHSETIQFVELTGPGVGPALESGRVSAAGIGNPVFADLMATGRYRTLDNPSQGIAPHYLTTGWIATTEYARKNPAIIKAFTGTLTKAAAYANAHPQETAPILAKYTGLDPAVIAKMARSHYLANLDPRDIQPVIEASARYGIIPKSFPARELIG